MVWTRLRLRDRVDARHLLMVGNAFDRLHWGKTRKAIQIPHRDQRLLDVVDVVRSKGTPPLIEDKPKPAAAMAGQGDVPARRIKAEVGVSERHCCCGFSSRGDPSAIASVGAMHAII